MDCETGGIDSVLFDTDVLIFVQRGSFTVLPFSENIGHRASVYVEEYALSHAVRAGDAIIAATAVEHHLPLATANIKHFRPIKELDLKVFKP